MIINIGRSVYATKPLVFKTYLKTNPVLIAIRNDKLLMGRGVQLCIFNLMIQIAVIDRYDSF